VRGTVQDSKGSSMVLKVSFKTIIRPEQILYRIESLRLRKIRKFGALPGFFDFCDWDSKLSAILSLLFFKY
jgi:hypothetical protein